MKTWLSWSSGKDSAWSLEMLRRGSEVHVTGLFTTINAVFDRVTMHAVRRGLVGAQARAAGLELHLIELPYPCPNADYERIMGAFVAEARAQGVEAMAFGDLFLADIRAYRERQLADTGIAPLFPLWGLDTYALAARDDRRRARGARDVRGPAQARSRVLQAVPSMPPSLPIFPLASIPAARTASSTPSLPPGRCFARPCPCAPARSPSATVSCSRTWCLSTSLPAGRALERRHLRLQFPDAGLELQDCAADVLGVETSAGCAAGSWCPRPRSRTG